MIKECAHEKKLNYNQILKELKQSCRRDNIVRILFIEPDTMGVRENWVCIDVDIYDITE